MAKGGDTMAPSSPNSRPPAPTSRILPAALATIILVASHTGSRCGAAEPPSGGSPADSAGKTCIVLADKRLEEPLGAIVGEYCRRTGCRVATRFLPAGEVETLVQKRQSGADLVVCMPKDKESKTPVESLGDAKAVAWECDTTLPVWTALVTAGADAAGLFDFLDGATAHQLWARSNFHIATGKTRAEAYQWIVDHRTKHTFPMTAARMLRECGGITDGVCVEIGCGSGDMAVELAGRSNFTIVGLDIDPDVKPMFEEKMRKAGLEKRVSFVLGDAQQLPFKDDSADVVVSRGTLIFVPDIGKCLREVDRILKPTGVAFLGGRYVFTAQKFKIPTESLRKIVAESGVPNAEVIDDRGQWVKIVGPKAPEAASQPQGGPHVLAQRFLADYAVTDGDCLVICGSDGGLEQALQQGLLELTRLKLTALYPNEKTAKQAEERIARAKLGDRIACRVGDIRNLPFEECSFDVVAGVGPVLIWGDRPKAMREIYRVLRQGGVALVGGKYLYMPEFRKVSSETLRDDAAKTGISSIRVIDDMGQWVEIRKGIKDRGFRD